MSKKFGWLTPSGRFVKCGLFQHLEVARKDEEIRNLPKVKALLDELHEIYEAHCEWAEREGSCNAEWHTYEMACDDAGPAIIRELYRHGFVRVGESDNSLHFEAFPNIIKRRHQECKDFAEQYGVTAVFEPQREPK